MIRVALPALALAFAVSQTTAPVAVTHTARALQPGEVAVLTIVLAQPATAIQVQAFNRAFIPFAVDPRTWKVLVGIDLDVKPGTHAVSVSATSSGAEARASHTLVVTAKTFPTRRLTVDPSFVNPPPEALERIQRDAAELERVWSAPAPERLWQDDFVRPVPDQSNSAFGSRSVFNGQARSPHAGADFSSPSGRPIAAPNRGRVALARDLYYAGNTIILDHGLGLFSQFAHLSAIKVKDGDVVTTGQVIGEVGATGRVTGPHLHWAVRLNGTRVDPLSLLAVLGK
jgi:murein DD-endopeptidase MepM/ murein hydrolase activator NlpD